MSIIRHRRKYTGKIPEISHKELVDRAFSYLQFSLSCSVVFKERVVSSLENPDAMGFKHKFSYLIECKSSRSDFLADKKKSFRKIQFQGMGYNRYYMTPVGLLDPEEIPKGWGLLEVYEIPRSCQNRTVKIVKESKDFHNRNLIMEVGYLVSAIRRLHISMAVFIDNNK